jgi:hypothetical protein
MFRLTDGEFADLRSQILTSNAGRGGRRHLPIVFTEYGALMAATILDSPRAVDVSAYVVRAFVQLRAMLAGNKELSAENARPTLFASGGLYFPHASAPTKSPSYSTVTDFARLRGLSTSVPRATAV